MGLAKASIILKNEFFDFFNIEKKVNNISHINRFKMNVLAFCISY